MIIDMKRKLELSNYNCKTRLKCIKMENDCDVTVSGYDTSWFICLVSFEITF